MIKITSFGSGSTGNGYLIDDSHSQILIECGVKLEIVKRKMRFDLSRVAGCAISHEHQDHSKDVQKLLKTTSIDIFASKGTLEAINVPKIRGNVLKIGEVVQIGTWKVSAFDVHHDAAEPTGFLFINQQGEKLIFVTDTYYVKYKFRGITHMMVEANYSLDIIKNKVAQEHFNEALKNRILSSHFELENSKNFIKANMSDQLQEVWLLHLSDSNSNEELFKREVQALTGVPVYIA